MDVEQINNFMSTASKEEVQYSDAQWLYINDSNFGGYNNYLQCQNVHRTALSWAPGWSAPPSTAPAAAG